MIYKSFIYKSFKHVSFWCLVILLAMFQQCSCLPDSSKEIDKARAKDNRDVKVRELHKKLNTQGKKEVFQVDLQVTRKKINQLAATPSSINPSNENQIIAICKKFLQENYIPYIELKKEFLTQVRAYEVETSKKVKREKKLQWVIANMGYVEELLRNSDVQKLYKFIMG